MVYEWDTINAVLIAHEIGHGLGVDDLQLINGQLEGHFNPETPGVAYGAPFLMALVDNATNTYITETDRNRFAQ